MTSKLSRDKINPVFQSISFPFFFDIIKGGLSKKYLDRAGSILVWVLKLVYYAM